MQNLKINADRLWSDIHETAAIGGTEKGGVRRLTLTDLDRQARDWLAERCRALGCDLTIDEVGNMFACLPGTDPSLPPIAMGSHLDTQPTGGKFDGIFGVLSGLEVLRSLKASGYRTRHPILLVNWTNEEGARFSPAMLGSGVYAGLFDRAYADARRDEDGVTFGEALEAIGYRGPAPAGAVRFCAMFELHIEQGPALEAANKEIGVVLGVQAMRWYDIEIGGTEAHAGSTPMAMRRDALALAARMILTVQSLADAHSASVATVGFIESGPNSRNVIPGRVRFSVDLRHPQDAVVDAMEAALKASVAALPAEFDVTCSEVWRSPAVHFDPACVDAVREGAARAGLSTLDLHSGAGHDAANIGRIVPTAMIFVPCLNGLSHNEAESITFTQCAAGAQALLNAILLYDNKDWTQV
ncbi:hydantoinase/carbamoylase family amidase [Rhizobium lusitanum]|uniref:Hydantoinase/carbamoylase family amidase n=1 Tax=Rhizobium lusitanum TaxID=293958 RepID=A0A6L9U8C0_9HYPH|nr:Zn-dependent hydrolase [Rhizobium lusitanum]NEI71609.1 hydantoinase/carbamoylase family amidase [Rhizobium lusitanum]